MPGEREPHGEDPDANWGKYLGVGLEIAVGVGLGYAIGYWLDKKYGWSPVGVLVGTMVGLAGGLYLLIKEALRMNADPPRKNADKPEDRR